MQDHRELSDEPHPASGHRTPREIAKDEAGPIGGTPDQAPKHLRAENGPVRPPDESLEPPAGSESELGRPARP